MVSALASRGLCYNATMSQERTPARPGAADRLRSILEQERKQGCADKVVIGGVERFLPTWAEMLINEGSTDSTANRDAAKSVIATLQGYREAALDDRQRRVDTALRHLTAMAEKPSPPSPPPRPEPVATTVKQAAPKASPRAPTASSLDFAPGRSTSSAAWLAGGLNVPVKSVPGVGPSYARLLEKMGVKSVRDFLYYFPNRHTDYSAMKRVKDLLPDENQSVLVTIWEVRAERARSGKLKIMGMFGDDTGTIEALWFNQRYLATKLKPGQQVVLSGKPRFNYGRPELLSPDWELLDSDDLVHTGRLVPVYPLTEGLNQRYLRERAKFVVDHSAFRLQDFLPAWTRETFSLPDLATAIAQAHFPDSYQDLTRANQRLAFDEVFLVQLGLLRRRREWQHGQAGNPMRIEKAMLNEFKDALPFQLTDAQRRVVREILADLKEPRPMLRLLQGDVGSGKTVVAAVAMVTAVANGFQSVIMAPTEILAEQHYQTFNKLLARPFAGKTCRVCLLTGKLKAAEKARVHEQIASGDADVVIGTHAVIQEGVQFKQLGLAIVDEQHRFGISQRTALAQKGYNPHLLVMTATPIPRSLALTSYADLDLSIIDELPPGRQQIETVWLEPRQRQRAYRLVRNEVAAGRQAFIICPLIEESDKIEARAATAEYERLQKEVFPDLRLGLLHGRMRPADKDKVMGEFRDGQLDILVSTPVVEVGIDIPNATVMVVEGADRFGLAQLHQFRGRVGRGQDKSYCILLTDSPSFEAGQRLQIVAQIHDGFKLAEEDLKMRGPGQFFGLGQACDLDLKMSRYGDMAVLEKSRTAARDLFERDPELAAPEHQALLKKLEEFWWGDLEVN